MIYSVLNLLPGSVPREEGSTLKYLKELPNQTTKAWSGYEHNVQASSGNIEFIHEDILEFVEHNFLPVEGRTLDGHYKFYVNWKTLKFIVIQDSYYGSLTYTTPAKEKGWKILNEKELPYLRAIIADKLLGAYYFAHDAVNQNGPNLFSTGEHEPAGPSWNEGIVRWTDGYKKCLLTDYKKYREESNNAKDKLGHLTALDFEAIQILTS